MTKAEKQRVLHENKILNDGLDSEQLAVIRKLIAPSTRLLNTSIYSKRTIEAILQGRRRDGETLREAIDLARGELKRCNEVMTGIEIKLRSNLI